MHFDPDITVLFAFGGDSLDSIYDAIMSKAVGLDDATVTMISTVAERYAVQVDTIRSMDPSDVSNYSKAVTAANNTVLTLQKLMPDNAERDENEGRMADILSAIRT